MNNETPNRKVHFFNMIRVTLIPCTKEYKEANIMHELWYNSDELTEITRQGLLQRQVYISQEGYDLKLCTKAQAKKIANELYDDPERCELIDNELENSNNIRYK